MSFLPKPNGFHKANRKADDDAAIQAFGNVPEKELEQQRASDRQWFDDHPDRSLYLRKALAYERDIADAACISCNAVNVVIVAKLTEIVRTRFFLTLGDKPVNKTMSEWTEAHNYEELLVSILQKMPCPQRMSANAFETVKTMRTRLKDTKLA